MEEVIAEIGITLLCLLGGGYVIGWMVSLLEYISMQL